MIPNTSAIDGVRPPTDKPSRRRRLIIASDAFVGLTLAVMPASTWMGSKRSP